MRSALDTALKTAKKVAINCDSKLIFFSDLHRGDNSYADDFAHNMQSTSTPNKDNEDDNKDDNKDNNKSQENMEMRKDYPKALAWMATEWTSKAVVCGVLSRLEISFKPRRHESVAEATFSLFSGAGSFLRKLNRADGRLAAFPSPFWSAWTRSATRVSLWHSSKTDSTSCSNSPGSSSPLVDRHF